MTTIQDRVVDFRRVRGADIEDHPFQHRTHSVAQEAQLDAILAEIGIAGVLLAYVSPSTGVLTAINGHMRKNSHPDLEWPTLVLDVTDQEALSLLAVYDPLADQAGTDPDHTARLLAQVQTRSPVLAEWLAQMREENALAAVTRSALTRQQAQQRPKLNERSQAIRVVLFAPEVATLERAIRLAGQLTSSAFPNRGEAFTAICQFYLDHADGES